MRARTIITVAVAMAATGTGTALAASSGSNIPNTKSGKLKPGQTKTFTVEYINSGTYSSKDYTGTVKIILPKSGTKPTLRLVKIKKKGNVDHGADYAATVENSNKSGTAPVTVKVIATTHVPNGGYY
jgi:hypothetical protein